MEEMKFCQSCGMPLNDEVLGTNSDGSKNEDYCVYCYKDGAFTQDFTMEQMAEHCAQFVDHFNQSTGQNLTREEYKAELMKFFPMLKRWNTSVEDLPTADSAAKQQLMDEINALGIADMPEVNELYVLQGSFVNMEYNVNGNVVKLLDDNAMYWGTQVEKVGTENRCYGVAANERCILVSEYGKDGADAELVVLKKR